MKIQGFSECSSQDIQNLDALFIVCHAPGHSVYTDVERHMTPLSKDLSDLILPYDYYGFHLDNRGRTIDATLEMIFKKAWETLQQSQYLLQIVKCINVFCCGTRRTNFNGVCS